MAEEIADLFVSIRADFSGLDGALRQTKGQLEQISAAGGLLGRMPEEVKQQATQIVTGVQQALAPFPNALRAGIEIPIGGVLASIHAMVSAQLQAIIGEINGRIQQINSLLAAAGSAGNTPTGGSRVIDARAEGGTVFAGQPYLVGERGPELFVPGSTGQIIPNEGLGGGSGMSITGGTFNIYGVQDVEHLFDQLQQVARRRR